MHLPVLLRIYSTNELPKELFTRQVQFPRKISINSSIACSTVALGSRFPNIGLDMLLIPLFRMREPSRDINIKLNDVIKIGFCAAREDVEISASSPSRVVETSWPSLNQDRVGRGTGSGRLGSSIIHSKISENSVFLTTSIYAAVKFNTHRDYYACIILSS